MDHAYSLLALDVDGTLLNDDHEITDVTRQALKALGSKGIELVLCTGRGPSNTLPLLEGLGQEGYVITHNGAATVRSKDRSIIHQFTFQRQDVQSLIEFCRAESIHFDINTVFDLYIETVTDDVAEMYEKFEIVPIRLKSLNDLEEAFVKFTMFGSMEQMDRIQSMWEELGCSLRMIRSGDQFIDVMHKEANKGNALRRFAEQKGLAPEAIIAMGNYYNDIEMLEYAGLGIAMDNSPEAVKAKADTVTASNNENGVYTALKQYIFS